MKLERKGGQKTALRGLKNRIIVYAGQYFDAETGLHYNYHRYYDPSLGRYLRADPIGLAGGINPYTYVSNNPTNLIDSLGLEGYIPGMVDVLVPDSNVTISIIPMVSIATFDVAYELYNTKSGLFAGEKLDFSMSPTLYGASILVLFDDPEAAKWYKDLIKNKLGWDLECSDYDMSITLGFLRHYGWSFYPLTGKAGISIGAGLGLPVFIPSFPITITNNGEFEGPMM